MIDVRYPTALQMVLSLAVAHERRVQTTSGELAAGLGANPALVRKLMVPLTRDGIITATLGRKGGVRLGRPPDAITLIDIYRSAVNDKRLFAIRSDIPGRCVVSRNIGRFFEGLVDEAEDRIETLLAGKTVAQSLATLRAMDQSAAADAGS